MLAGRLSKHRPPRPGPRPGVCTALKLIEGTAYGNGHLVRAGRLRTALALARRGWQGHTIGAT